jgi:hypothetical protein
MQRVLKPGGTLLLADIRIPRGAGWHLLAALTGTAAMAHNAPPLEPLVASAGLGDLQSGEVPWMRYVRAIKPEIPSRGAT